MAQSRIRMGPTAARKAILDGTWPPGAVVEGDLRLDREPGLAELPDGLAVEGELRIDRCHRLARLPKRLAAQGVRITTCDAFQGLGPGEAAFCVPGDLNLIDCPALAHFPGELVVGGDLRMGECPRAWSDPSRSGQGAPERLIVGGSVAIEECAGLAGLPHEIDVGGDLNVARCPKLVAVGGGPGARIAVGEGRMVHIERCNGLWLVASIEWRGGGTLRITDCAALERIADGVLPQWSLTVHNCHSLTRLPSRLVLDGDLVAHDCPSLRTVHPPDVNGNIMPTGTTPRWEVLPTPAEAPYSRRRGPSPSP